MLGRCQLVNPYVCQEYLWLDILWSRYWLLAQWQYWFSFRRQREAPSILYITNNSSMLNFINYQVLREEKWSYLEESTSRLTPYKHTHTQTRTQTHTLTHLTNSLTQSLTRILKTYIHSISLHIHTAPKSKRGKRAYILMACECKYKNG